MELVVKRFEELSLEELYEILKIRVAVFVVEQKCPYPEVDGNDYFAYHVFLRNEEGVQAYLRVLDPGVTYKEASIGRVLSAKRGVGLGRDIMTEGIKVARERVKADIVRIEAQVYAREFYEQFGFVKDSEEFLEDGIPHMEMILEGLQH